MTAEVSPRPFGTIAPSSQSVGTEVAMAAVTAASPGAGKWVWRIGDANFSGTVDSIQAFGYNIGPQGTAIVAGEPGVATFMEADYNTGSVRQMEWYVQFLTTAPATKRPLMFTFNRSTGALACTIMPFTVGVDGTGTAIFQINDGSSGVTQWLASASYDNQLLVKAAAGKYASLSLSANGTDAAFVARTFGTGANQSQFKINGNDVNWYKNGNGGTQLAVGGVDDNSGVIVADSANTSGFVTTFVARAKSSQDAAIPVLSLQESGGTAHIYVTPPKAATAASLVLAKAAIATTATDGFVYLPKCAGTPTGVPTTQNSLPAAIYDTTGHKLWIYDSGWKSAVFA